MMMTSNSGIPAAPSAEVVLQADKLLRIFGGLVAVDAVSFDVRRHEIFGVIGPNGAGKTTLFNLITGLTPLSGGHLLHMGQPIDGLPPHRIAARGIARTFQNIRLFGNLSALQNVLIARHLRTRSGIFTGVFALPLSRYEERQNQIKALELLDLVGLGGRGEMLAKNFAYGDQRRLEIARALALEPTLLLLDEPAAGLNPQEKQGLSDFIRGIRQQFNLTVLLIEHHVPLVMGLCDRVAVLNFGKLLTLGTPEQVQNDPAVIEAYLGETPA
jgi:branched-chain amino acid transport system ATP-binding protein